MTTATPPTPTTLADLRASGHRYKAVKHELRTTSWPGWPTGGSASPGSSASTTPCCPSWSGPCSPGTTSCCWASAAGQDPPDPRSCHHLLDEWTPVVAGCEINDHPYVPTCVACRRRLDELGDELPVAWRHRSERYGEKLATPDTSVGDLIGDIDPIKVAEGRTLGDPETVHYGLVPRTNRGIFSVNELPDLAERIQVALLNVLEERDIQVRGYQLPAALDLLLIASANPEDYTNRGRIITPLKDRFGAEVRTHYPLRLDDELTLIRQEAVLAWDERPLGRPWSPATCSR